MMHLKSAISDQQLLQIGSVASSAQLWRRLRELKEPTGLSAITNAIAMIYETRCTEDSQIDKHITRIRNYAIQLGELGEAFPDYLLATVYMRSLPPSYKPFVDSFWGTQTSSDLKTIKSEDVITRILSEFRRRKSDKERDDWESANSAVARGKRTSKKRNPDIECSNCHKKGHSQAQCYAKGGGSEGQGPRQKKAREDEEKKKKEEASKVEPKEEAKANVAIAQPDKETDFAFNVDNANPVTSRTTWLADSAASSHFVNNINMFTEFTPDYNPVKGVGGNTESIGHGTVIIKSLDNTPITLLDVKLLPKHESCLLSIGRFEAAGGEVKFKNGGCGLYMKGRLILKGKRVRNLYELDTKTIFPIESAAVSIQSRKLSWNEAHRTLGHLSLTSMKKIFQHELITGIHVDPNVTPEIQCESCIQSKAARKPFPRESPNQAKQSGDLTHTDIWGPAKTESIHHEKYFVTLIDDNTRRITVRFLKSKSDVQGVIKNYIAWIETQLERRPKAIRPDNAKEYMAMKSWLDEKGIELQPSAPYSPQQNGAAERMNRTLVELATAMLIEKNLPKFLWTLAIQHAAYIRNRSPTAVLTEMTPEEAWTGHKPDVTHLREFGVDVWIMMEGERAKMDAKAVKRIFVGFDDGQKAIRYYSPGSHFVATSRNFYFMKAVLADNQGNVSLPTPGVQGTPIEGENNMKSIESSPEIPDSPHSVVPDSPHSPNIEIQPDVTDSTDRTPHIGIQTRLQRNVIQRRDYQELNGGRPRLRAQMTVTESEGVDRDSSRLLQDTVMIARLGNDDTPSNLKEAKSSGEWPKWEQAINEELNMLNEMRTWELAEKPSDRKLIGNRWVFVKKCDTQGNVVRYKARLVAQGYSQIPGLDYSFTFSPVIRLDSLRIMFALAAILDVEMYQMDIKGAYLNGKLEEDLYMHQPEGFGDGSDYVCKLRHTLYGLKQSGREWNKAITSLLISKKFTQAAYDPCVYYRWDGNEFDMLGLWVDDFDGLSSNWTRAEIVLNEIRSQYTVTFYKEPKLLLGIEIYRDRPLHSITITLGQYIRKILKRFGMEDCRPARTPFPPNILLEPATENNLFSDITKYRSLVGALMFATITCRPDVAYSVNQLSQFNVRPSTLHWDAALHVLRYLKGTINYGITYDTLGGEATLEPITYSDADNGKAFHGRAISGGVLLLAGGAIKWTSAKQKLVTMSTMEAEYVAANVTARHLKWATQFLSDLGFRQCLPLTLFIDNQSAIRITKNPEQQHRTQHIAKHYHWLREQYETGLLEPEYIPSNENIADIFTKSLPAITFDKHRLGLGMLEQGEC